MPQKRKAAKTAVKPKRSASPDPRAFLAAGDDKVIEVDRYMWNCYGKTAVYVDLDIPLEIGAASMIVDITGCVYEMMASDYSKPKPQQAYKWRNPAYQKAHDAEAKTRGQATQIKFAWDKIKWAGVPAASILKRVRDMTAAAKKKNPPK